MTTDDEKKLPLGLKIIGIIKLLTAFMLACTALGVFRLMNNDIGETLESMVTILHLDPKRHVINEVLSDISGLSHRELREIGAGTLVYSALYAIEGIGLLRGKHWAEYLVVIITGSLMPLEIYEIVEKTSMPRIGVLVANIAMVAYLIWRIRRDRKNARIEAELKRF